MLIRRSDILLPVLPPTVQGRSRNRCRRRRATTTVSHTFKIARFFRRDSRGEAVIQRGGG